MKNLMRNLLMAEMVLCLNAHGWFPEDGVCICHCLTPSSLHLCPELMTVEHYTLIEGTEGERQECVMWQVRPDAELPEDCEDLDGELCWGALQVGAFWDEEVEGNLTCHWRFD